MHHAPRFSDVLDAVDQLPPDEQQTLLEIVQKRMTEQARKRLISEVRAANRDFSKGRCKPVSMAQIMDEILS